MTRYYFDVTTSAGTYADASGTLLAGRRQVQSEANSILRDLARDEDPDGIDVSFTTVARDESGTLIFTATLSVKGQWL